MLHLLQKLKPTTLITRQTLPFHPTSFPSFPPIKFYTTNNTHVDPVALQMINYALSLPRSQKTPDSYAQGLLVLEQCLSSNPSNENTKGSVLLAMANLLSERGDLYDAMEKLENIQDLGCSSLGLKVAAMEGLVGLNLEIGQDVASELKAEECLKILKPNSDEIEVAKYHASGIKGLVALVTGNIEKAGMCFGGTHEDKGCSGNVMFSHGEFLHATGKFALAKEFYQKTIEGVTETEGFTDPHGFGTCNMVPVEVLLGATCALGQLEAHSGNFNDAEEILTRALTKAEEHFALMFRHKAKMERSSSILIQEGLYRKAIGLLKAPDFDAEDAKAERIHITALVRGAYAEILSVQQNRKTEGDRMMKWAEAKWRDNRLSLAEALDISERPSKVTVIDTRISRAL